MKFPYAIRDFDKLISGGYLYLDRTDRIPLMEEIGSELLFLRPRRFGKSLWLSTLMNYYDVAKAGDFERLFGKLAIGRNPTPLHNQYLVMRWDFSEVKSHGTIQEIERALHQHVNQWIRSFVNNYAALFPHLTSQVIIDPENALASFHSAVENTRRTSYKLYLFIDEYDNFANEVMMGQQGDNHQRYLDLVKGEGMFKTFFKNLKSAGSGEGLDRVFMTGVSPIIMNDVTSGSNVTKNITWRTNLSDLCGFRQDEIQPMVQSVIAGCGLPPAKVDEAMEMMRIFYNGSRFALRNLDQLPKVYNPILVFYFLEELQTDCLYPDNMLDSNFAPDYNKLVYISSHPTGRELLLDTLHPEREVSVVEVGDRFGVKEMLEPDKQYERLASLLCYLGALTVASKSDTGKWVLEIPNLVMRKLYAERILEMTFPKAADRDQSRMAAEALFAHAEIAPLCDFVETHYFPIYDNRDYKEFDELTLKTLFLCLLHYRDLYIIDSEPALQRTYADLVMLIRPEMRHYSVYDLLLEFKYIPLSQVGSDKTKEEKSSAEKSKSKKPDEKKRLAGTEIRQMSRQTLLALDTVQQQLAEAKIQLQNYRQVLQQKYGATLKLRTFALVSIGLERIVWQEVSA